MSEEKYASYQADVAIEMYCHKCRNKLDFIIQNHATECWISLSVLPCEHCEQQKFKYIMTEPQIIELLEVTTKLNKTFQNIIEQIKK